MSRKTPKARLFSHLKKKKDKSLPNRKWKEKRSK